MLKQLTFILFFLFLTIAALFSQKKTQIQIIQADNLVSREVAGQKIQVLIGDVIFKHQNALMYCDSAYNFTSTNRIEAFGSVRINQGDTLNLYGDHLDYNGNTQLATVDGKIVRLETSDFILYTDRLYYDRLLQQATYLTGGKIIGKQDSNTLISERGYYLSTIKRFTFKDSVQLTNPDFEMFSDTLKYFTQTKWVEFLGPTEIFGDSNYIYCENGWYDTDLDRSEYYDHAFMISDNRILRGDTLYYDRVISYGRAVGNVEIEDTTENIIIYGQLAKLYELKDSVVVTDKAYMVQIMEEDSLFMRADTFKVYKNLDDERQLFGYHDIKIFKNDLQAICDSIAYTFVDSTIRLYHDPVMWTENNQMTAIQIDILTADSKIHSMFLDQDAFIIEQVDSIRFNQIKGKVMTAFFKDSELSLIEVRGNGQTTYYGLDEQDRFIGVNVLESSDLDIRMKDKKINTIKYINQPKGIMHPIGDLDPVKDLRYSGFQWRIKEKPEKSDCMY